MNDENLTHQKLKQRLSHYRSKLDQLEFKTRQKEIDTRLNKEIELLRDRETELGSRLEEMQKTDGAAWEIMRSTIDQAVQDFETAVDKLFKGIE